MGANFIRKLMGRSPPLPPEVREALEELARLAEERPALAASAHFLRDALPGLYAEPIEPAAPAITNEQALAKVGCGLPVLHGEMLPLDVAAFKRRWLHICSSLERHQESPAVVALAEAFRRDSLDPRQLTTDVLNGHADAIHARADGLGLDAGLTATVLRLTLFPVLSGVNTVLAPMRAGRRWERGYCPTCGSWPLLGEFRGLEQTRFLRCGLCAAGWEFPRLRCPFCETQDHRQLGYFYVEAETGKYRTATCADCRGYVKMISSLTELSPPGLLVADLATMHLDLVAADRGYEHNPSPKQRLAFPTH